MKWSTEDIKSYSEAKEYVDTAIIPLIGLDLGDGISQSASMAEYIGLLAAQLERQFTGRLLLLPPFTYLKDEDPGVLAERLGRWEERLAEAGLRHVFLLTSDQSWREVEGKFKGSLIWLPALPLATMEDNQKVLLINDQVKQLMQLFTARWRAE
ncbi:YpiF family protein [Neobacillus sp. YIM B06451]|uniref:YpiF family protein n=1 Tax=Neobacillus sp. YIM B06451 TaxID=3070994 RepID=UPI00293193E7|nr:YpiF family protein [Neobacillus sp. YIM B06451]